MDPPAVDTERENNYNPDELNNAVHPDEDTSQKESSPLKTMALSCVGDSSHSGESDEDNVPLLRLGVKVYPRRWFTLFVFCLVTLSNGCIWISLSAVTDIVERYYKIRAILVDWLSLSFLLAPAIMAIPGTYILARLGLKVSIALPAGFHALGTSIRLAGAGRKYFPFVAVGQSIASLGTIFILAAPPRIAAVWFGDDERTIATTISVLANTVGISLGFLLTTLLVPDISNLSEIGDGLRNLLLYHACFCTVVFLVVLIFVRDKPPSPPSLSQALRDNSTENGTSTSFFQSVQELLQNKNYLLISCAYSINFGTVFGVPTLLNQMIKEGSSMTSYHIPENRVGWIGFTGPVGGILGSLLIGAALNKHKRYKIVTCVCLFFTAAAIVGFAQALIHTTNLFVVAAMFTIFCVFSYPYLSFGLDHIAEISYPISEGSSTTLPMILGNTAGFLMIYVFQIVIDHGHLRLVLYLFCGFEGLAFLFSLLAKTEMKRLNADQLRVDGSVD